MPPSDWEISPATRQSFADEDARFQAAQTRIAHSSAESDYARELFERRQSMARALRGAGAERRFEDGATPTKWEGGLSPMHRSIAENAGRYPAAPGTREWNTVEALKWKAGGGDIVEFKEQWIAGHRDAILAAANKYDLPPGLVAGIAFNEVGGDPDWADDVGYHLLNPLRGKPQNQTSFGDMSVQVRRAGQSLDYGNSLNGAQVDAIIRDLRNPTTGIFLAAKHLSDLRDLDFSGTKGKHMSAEQVEITASRYNRGPQFSIDEIRSDTGYGRDITKRWDRLQSLLNPNTPQ